MIYLWPFMRLLATIALFFVPTLTAFGAENLQDCYKGRNAHKMGNYDLAIAYQTRCIDHGGLTDDNLEAAYTRRGASYGRKGEYDRAIADYTAVIRLDPNNAFAYNNRGTAYHLKD